MKLTICSIHTFHISLSGPSGVYRPGSVLKYTCEVNIFLHFFKKNINNF